MQFSERRLAVEIKRKLELIPCPVARFRKRILWNCSDACHDLIFDDYFLHYALCDFRNHWHNDSL